MADDFQLGITGNWWDTSRSSYDGGTTPAAPISTALNAVTSFGWPTQAAEAPPCSVLANPNLRIMGSDWNVQARLGEKGEDSFRSMLEEDMRANGRQYNWRSNFKQINRGAFSEDEPRFSETSSTPDFQVVDSASVLLSEFQQHSQTQQMGYSYPLSGYELHSPPPVTLASTTNTHSHFSGKTPFSNASPPPAAVAYACSTSFFPTLEPQISDEKPKNTSEVRDLGTTTKKNKAETTNKRARVETPSPLPAAFKVRKEKMGDRITALQQLVSPFGKTDTASVLSEAIEYIKFLHEQVGALSIPYMQNGAPVQNYDKPEGEGEVLASRGLCLVPVSSTFPVTHETTLDFWTPTFGPPAVFR
ncbi:basic helix-loop-helix DNA-binding superfamily protein [Perilla frutescens var. hirtella]|nr:basic helix-loop-helix DNA-binding superfamily protein [Perilla frutescens var. frutescens]KAH6786453.1 basic helix-loop-helix DNA-binding superfamily protein [Perilla frutescens var. hirtella]